MASGRLVDYIGKGTDADKPVSPDLQTDTLGLYYSTDTKVLWLWNDDIGVPAWEEFTPIGEFLSLGDVDDTTPPTDGQCFVWHAATSKFIPFDLASAGIPDAPNDGTMYVRHSLGWLALPAYPDVSTFISDSLHDGTIYARKDGAWVHLPASASSLITLTDYDNTTPATDGQVVTWDNTASKFKPKTPTGGGGGSPRFRQHPAFISTTQSATAAAGYWLGRGILIEEDCTIDEVCSYMYGASSGLTYRPAIYADGGPTVGLTNLLGSGSAVTGVTAGLNQFPLSSSIVVTAGTLLWVGLVGDPSTVTTTCKTLEPGTAAFFACVGAPPSTPSGITYSSADWNMFFYHSTN